MNIRTSCSEVACSAARLVESDGVLGLIWVLRNPVLHYSSKLLDHILFLNFLLILLVGLNLLFLLNLNLIIDLMHELIIDASISQHLGSQPSMVMKPILKVIGVAS